MNISPINTTNQNKPAFGSLSKVGDFTAQEIKYAIEPLEEISKRHFGDFGEIHLNIERPEQQTGRLYDCKPYDHDYNVSIYPLGQGEDKPVQTFRIVTRGLRKFGEQMAEIIDNNLSIISKILKSSGTKNSKEAIDEFSAESSKYRGYFQRRLECGTVKE